MFFFEKDFQRSFERSPNVQSVIFIKSRNILGAYHPSRDCLNFLHAAWKHHAGYFFFTKYGKFEEPARRHFVGLQCSVRYLNYN